MKGVYHNSWYAQFNVQDLGDCLSTRFGSEEFLQPPFFPEFEQSLASEADAVRRDSESQTRLVELGDVPDPRAWSPIYKVFISILLNAFPLVVAVGTSILSPASKDLVREFNTKSELTVLTTSLFMLVGGWSMRHHG